MTKFASTFFKNSLRIKIRRSQHLDFFHFLQFACNVFRENLADAGEYGNLKNVGVKGSNNNQGILRRFSKRRRERVCEWRTRLIVFFARYNLIRPGGRLCINWVSEWVTSGQCYKNFFWLNLDLLRNLKSRIIVLTLGPAQKCIPR